MLKPKELSDIRRPLLIGHRGYPARYPENTLAAFTGAMDAGCDMIELDVTLSRDRRVVVIHDDTLDRTTNGKGPVRDRTAEDIEGWTPAAGLRRDFPPSACRSWTEVIALTAARCMLNIEIKESAFEADYPVDAVEHQVVKLVKTSGAMGRVIISSFDQRILERIAAMDAPPAVAYISDHGADKGVMEMLLAMKAFSWHPRFTVLTRDQVDMLHAAGLKVFPWTINTRAEAEKVLALGVDGLICNELRVLRAV